MGRQATEERRLSGLVDQLISEGRHAEAAREARAAGDLVRAAAIYAQIWDFRHAAACAEESGDRVAALRIDRRRPHQIPGRPRLPCRLGMAAFGNQLID